MSSIVGSMERRSAKLQYARMKAAIALVFWVSLLARVRAQGYAPILAEQLNQYCDLHNRCPSPRENLQPARIGKSGPRGHPGPIGAPGRVNYTKVEAVVDRKLEELTLNDTLAGFTAKLSRLESEITLNDTLAGLTARLSRLESEFNKMSHRDCLSVDPTDAVIRNATGGVFEIYLGRRKVEVFCDLISDGGGWMVFQRRMDGSESFEKNWAEYVAGFGKPQGEFWLGLEKLHRFTHQSAHEMKIDMEDWEGNKYYALYTTFSIGTAEERYALNVGGFSGTAGGDSLAGHNGHRFVTVDQDNSNSDASKYKGGWWYPSGYYSNLNGKYMNQWKYSASRQHGIEWWHLHRVHWYSLKFVEMKIRPKN